MGAGPKGDRFTVRFPSALADKLRTMAALQNTDVSVIVRDLVAQGLARKGAAAAQGPLVEALHNVLPRYFEPLAAHVVSTRFDAVVARELVKGATMATLLNQEGMTVARAQELVTATMGQAVKIAKRRVREQPDLSPGPQEV